MGFGNKNVAYEPLNLFVYDKPHTPAEREHNKTVLKKAGSIRAKRLPDAG